MLPGLVGGRPKSLLARAQTCLEQVGLAARMRHKPRELSGGEQQRVAIARAFVNKPKWLLCDEPTGNLDTKTGDEVIEVLTGMRKRDKVGLVLVTHAAALAKLADRTVQLEDGRIKSARG